MTKHNGSCPNCGGEVPHNRFYCSDKCGRAWSRRLKRSGKSTAPTVKAKEQGHTHYIASYVGECIRCRNERRWTAYRASPFPIFGKSGVVRTQA